MGRRGGGSKNSHEGKSPVSPTQRNPLPYKGEQGERQTMAAAYGGSARNSISNLISSNKKRSCITSHAVSPNVVFGRPGQNIGWLVSMLCGKQREAEQQPSKAKSRHLIECFQVSHHFLYAILSSLPVKEEDTTFLSAPRGWLPYVAPAADATLSRLPPSLHAVIALSCYCMYWGAS